MNEAGLAVVVSMRDNLSGPMQQLGKNIAQTRVETINFRLALIAVGGVLNQFGSLLRRIDDPAAKVASQFLMIAGNITMAAGAILLAIPRIQDLIVMLRGLAVAQGIVAALSGPVGWVSLGIAAAVGAGAYFGTKALTAPPEAKPGQLTPYAQSIVEAAGIKIQTKSEFLRMENEAAMKKFYQNLLEAQQESWRTGMVIPPASKSGGDTWNIKIEGGPLILEDDAAMKKFAQKITDAQREQGFRGR